MFRRTTMFLALLTAAFVTVPVHAQLAATTLEAEAGNNTSASDKFQPSNGNVKPGNVSKLSLKNLLYEGSTTKILAHFMGWWGGPDHIQIGYNSADEEQVHKQVEDMVARGIDGVIIEWYGPADTNRFASARNTDQAAEWIMKEADNRTGFEFSIMIDKGALKSCANRGCNVTGELIRQVNYIHDKYERSAAYTRVNGRPIITVFDLDLHYKIDWNAVRKNVRGNPLFVYQDARGFATSGASYSWVKLDIKNPRNWMAWYLDTFYRTGKAKKDWTGIGATYKGFDDSVASWSLKRNMSQDCGQTWLNTWAKINENYSQDEQLPFVQLVTWNDYEEGTELETGIDNCVAVDAGMHGDSLRWRVRWTQERQRDNKENGDSENRNPEATIDHYAVFVTRDGQNLTQIAELPIGSDRLGVTSFNLPAGDYKAYVKAVAKPGLLNQMSRPVGFRVR